MLTALLVVAALFVMGYFFRHAALGIVRGPIFLLAHYFYYRDEVWTENTWMGHKLMKLPFDLWTYQEIIYRTKPDIIVETGTFEGGSAQYFAALFDLMGAGKVITVDIDARAQPPHHRIEYLSGSSTAPEIFADVKSMIPADARVMVVLDSDHSEKHVREE
ncbi:MAG TPA: CmcI family methyltransferase, partial [Candidatus Binatia bacterium]|nr:CmcI family methyltransferase [Candidatus Binatia bacterium]